MKTKKTKSPNWGLLDKKRFEKMERERIEYLRNLNIKKSIKMAEELIDFANEFRNNFFLDHPVCLKIGLMKRKNA